MEQETEAHVANGLAETRATDRWPVVALAAIGLFITLLNAIKPLALDDSVYYLFVVHIAEHPLDPYGFQPDANEILAPPVFLYWWAMAVRLFGQQPVYWKLWLLPINLLLVFSLYALGRRFARGMELFFVSMVTLSAAVLPCVNLMLDIPALALMLLAIVLFLRACSADSLIEAAAAGLVAGIAAQTKYTAFVVPGVMVLYTLQRGKWRLGLVAASLAGLLFIGWELFIVWRYGDSHFWLAYKQTRAPLLAKVRLVQPLFGYLGSTMAAGVPLALAALGRSPRAVWGSAGLIVLVFAFVAFPDGPVLDYLRDSLLTYPGSTLTAALFGIIGLFLTGAVAMIVWRLVRQPLTFEGLPARKWYDSADGFLVLWLALEFGGYFVLSPYPATRRVMGLVVVALLLTCRLAARKNRVRGEQLWGVAAFNFLLGLLLFVVDFNLYYGQQVVVRDVASVCRQQRPQSDIWYLGNHAFGFCAQRLGMKPLTVNDQEVQPEDWVVVVDELQPVYSRHPISLRGLLQNVHEWRPILPLLSQYQFGNVAVKRTEGPSTRATLYRVQ